jgi:polyhydroxyalkanoate synthesis regulator phasin
LCFSDFHFNIFRPQQLESQRAVYEQQARLFEQQKSDIQRGYQSQIDELTRQLHDITNQKSIQAVQAQATVMPAPMPAQPPVYPDQQRLVDELRQQVNDKQRQLDEQLSKMQTLTQNLMTAQNEFAKLSETHQVRVFPSIIFQFKTCFSYILVSTGFVTRAWRSGSSRYRN